MKRKIVVSTLLAIVLLLIPCTVLADDPNGGVDVDIGIITGGDVDVGLGIEAGGDVTVDVGTNGDVNVNGDNLVNTSVLGNALASSRGDGDEYSYHLVRANRDAIAALWQIVGNDMTHDMWLIAGAVEQNIKADSQQTKAIWLAGYTLDELEAELNAQEEWIIYLDKSVAFSAEWDTLLASEIDATNAKVYQLEARLYQEEQRANLRLFLVIGVALAIVISLGVAQDRLRRKIKEQLR